MNRTTVGRIDIDGRREIAVTKLESVAEVESTLSAAGTHRLGLRQRGRQATDRRQVARAVPRRSLGRARRRAAAGRAADDHRRRSRRHRDPHAQVEAEERNALEDPQHGRSVGPEPDRGRTHLADVWLEAASDDAIQSCRPIPCSSRSSTSSNST